MRVRLSYSSELEEAPAKMADLLGKELKTLEDSTKLLYTALTLIQTDPSYAGSSAAIIDDVRKKLNGFDFVLSDCFAVLSGYDAQTNPQQPVAQQEPEQKTVSPPEQRPSVKAGPENYKVE
jgi:hypothetical protein